MKIERKMAGDVVILHFTGEFDAFNLPQISEGIDQLIQKGSVLLVFNLKGLKFINSSALGYLMKTHRRVRELEGELVLAEPSKFFQTTISTLGIDQIFKIFPNDEEAVKYTVRAGIDPRGIPEMFRILLDERQRSPSSVSSWFSTHPLEEERIRETEAQIAKINPAILNGLTKDSRSFQSFKQRVRSLPASATRAGD